jgi:hypothetical protein
MFILKPLLSLFLERDFQSSWVKSVLNPAISRLVFASEARRSLARGNLLCFLVVYGLRHYVRNDRYSESCDCRACHRERSVAIYGLG